MSEIKAVLGDIKRANGIAGQITYSVAVAYPGEEERARFVSFVGNVSGGPVVMVTESMPRGVFVTDPARFGTFGPEWVRRFFA